MWLLDVLQDFGGNNGMEAVANPARIVARVDPKALGVLPRYRGWLEADRKPSAARGKGAQEAWPRSVVEQSASRLSLELAQQDKPEALVPEQALTLYREVIREGL